MMRFHIIDDAAIILRSKGVFRQAKAYTRDGGLYAGYGSGFIRLSVDGHTSLPNVSWVETDVPYRVGDLGRLDVASAKTIAGRIAA